MKLGKMPPISTYNDAMHPYTAVRRAGDLLFISGQLGVDADGQLKGDIAAEAMQALANMRARLGEHGASLADAVKVNVYLADIADRTVFDGIYSEQFPIPQPARSCIAAGALPFGARIEIEAIVHFPRRDTEKESPIHA
jgi:reactive intermediate/imine deaminase